MYRVLYNSSHVFSKNNLQCCPNITHTRNKRTTEFSNLTTTNLELWKFNLTRNIAPPLLTSLVDIVTKPVVVSSCSCIVKPN